MLSRSLLKEHTFQLWLYDRSMTRLPGLAWRAYLSDCSLLIRQWPVPELARAGQQ